jgi:hypothetical protein
MLEQARAQGAMTADDCEVAAQQFMSLCRGNVHFRYSLNLIERPTQDEIRRTVAEAVETFMARYGRTRAVTGPEPR